MVVDIKYFTLHHFDTYATRYGMPLQTTRCIKSIATRPSIAYVTRYVRHLMSRIKSLRRLPRCVIPPRQHVVTQHSVLRCLSVLRNDLKSSI
ncbi:unnamed protein product [Rhodiola kirilowii]